MKIAKSTCESGFTLVEVMIVVALIGLVVVLAMNGYQAWAQRYRVENDVKEMFAGLMDARASAMQKKRVHFVTMTATGYGIYEDTNPAPDGDGVLTAADTFVRRGAPRSSIISSPAAISFFRDGTVSISDGYIRLSSPVAADYDCIHLGKTRVKIGRFNGAACVEK